MSGIFGMSGMSATAGIDASIPHKTRSKISRQRMGHLDQTFGVTVKRRRSLGIRPPQAIMKNRVTSFVMLLLTLAVSVLTFGSGPDTAVGK
jgi:hypothetical protein